MPETNQELTLGLKNGAAEERFQRELQRVLKNIRDPNTSGTAKRTITMTFELTPAEDRSYVAVTVLATSKMAPYTPVYTFAHLRQNGDEVAALEAVPTRPGEDPRQMRVLPMKPKE